MTLYRDSITGEKKRKSFIQTRGRFVYSSYIHLVGALRCFWNLSGFQLSPLGPVNTVGDDWVPACIPLTKSRQSTPFMQITLEVSSAASAMKFMTFFFATPVTPGPVSD